MMFSLITVGLFGFFCFRGFPKKKAAYRWLLGLLAILSIAASVDSYVHYVIGRYYFPDQAAWPFLILSALGLVCFAAFLGEIVFLVWLRARAKKEPNQSPEPPPSAAH